MLSESNGARAALALFCNSTSHRTMDGGIADDETDFRMLRTRGQLAELQPRHQIVRERATSKQSRSF
jgi:hypothetical protein